MSDERARRARAAHKAAAEELQAAVERAYPVGTVVTARTAHGHIITAEVTAHSFSYWYRPGSLHIRNVDTGGRHTVEFEALEP